VRTSEGILKGYDAADLADPWSRYVADQEDPLRELRETTKGTATEALGPPHQESATSATPQHLDSFTALLDATPDAEFFDLTKPLSVARCSVCSGPLVSPLDVADGVCAPCENRAHRAQAS